MVLWKEKAMHKQVILENRRTMASEENMKK